MDHHVDRAITAGLRQRGFDVLIAFEDGYARRCDEDLLARATQLGRVLFSFDADFLAITAQWQATGMRFAGLIYGRSRAMSIGVAIDDISLILEVMSAAEMENMVVWIPL
jgi:hypothetical protein